ncbi:hypothetical protein [Pseudomonas typographi]|uniref:hypothetical protein n=1 Tax=Pseudomonas typographi TaxID=2715964 RepID=UPI001688431E|nr:hypothetical protein [Pseudomonas typographi]MBD1555218.1 hypothetical protein [Pseudomonas typographi]
MFGVLPGWLAWFGVPAIWLVRQVPEPAWGSKFVTRAVPLPGSIREVSRLSKERRTSRPCLGGVGRGDGCSKQHVYKHVNTFCLLMFIFGKKNPPKRVDFGVEVWLQIANDQPPNQDCSDSKGNDVLSSGAALTAKSRHQPANDHRKKTCDENVPSLLNPQQVGRDSNRKPCE